MNKIINSHQTQFITAQTYLFYKLCTVFEFLFPFFFLQYFGFHYSFNEMFTRKKKSIDECLKKNTIGYKKNNNKRTRNEIVFFSWIIGWLWMQDRFEVVNYTFWTNLKQKNTKKIAVAAATTTTEMNSFEKCCEFFFLITFSWDGWQLVRRWSCCRL